MIPNLLKLNRYKKFIVKSIFIATKLSKTLENTQNHSINIFPHSYGITFNMENSNNQLLICKQMSKITFNIPQLVKDATYTSGKEVLIFFFSPVNKNPKCIRNASEMHPKYYYRYYIGHTWESQRLKKELDQLFSG